MDSEEYEKALSHIKRIQAWGCADQVLVLFEAVCVYEQGDDLRALELLVEFLKTDESHRESELCKIYRCDVSHQSWVVGARCENSADAAGFLP